MSNKKTPSAFVNFVAAASITALLSGCNTDTNEDNQIPEEESTQSFMSDNTRSTYGKYVDFITSYTPGMNLLTLTPQDIGIDFTEQDKENLALLSMCPPNFNPQTPEMVETIQKLEVAQDSVQSILKSLSEGDEPFISKEVFVETLMNNNREFSEYTSAAATIAITGEAAAVSFNNTLINNNKNTAIISMPDTFNSQETIESLSGLKITDLNNIESTSEDVMIYILGHEIAGHAYNEHNGDSLNADYNCTMINDIWIDQSNGHESIGDIMGSLIHKEAQKAGLATQANTTEEMHALRSLGNLYIGNNFTTTGDTTHVNVHVTTIIFDPKSPDATSALDNTGTALIPSVINRLADAISGFIYTQDFKKELSANPDDYTAEQHELFSSLPDNPNQFIDNIDNFAPLGQELRFGIPAIDGAPEFKQQPQWHYAAIAFIDKHNLLATVENETIAEYGAALNDLITDFLNAADKHASKLKDPSISEKIEKTLKPEHFRSLDFNTFIGIKEEEMTETATLAPGL